MKIFQFKTFHVNVQQFQNHGVLGSTKQMDLLYLLMVKLNIYYYLIMGCLIKFVIRLNMF